VTNFINGGERLRPTGSQLHANSHDRWNKKGDPAKQRDPQKTVSETQ